MVDVFATLFDGFPSGCAIWPIQRSMLACTEPPWPPKKKTATSASSLSPEALGRANAATRIDEEGALDTQPFGASNFSAAAAEMTAAEKVSSTTARALVALMVLVVRRVPVMASFWPRVFRAVVAFFMPSGRK